MAGWQFRAVAAWLLAAASTHLRETQMKIVIALFIGATLGLFAAAICAATD